LQYLPFDITGAFTKPISELEQQREAVERKLLFGQPIRTLEELEQARLAAGGMPPQAAPTPAEEELKELRRQLAASR
jgi:hypothetical protein